MQWSVRSTEFSLTKKKKSDTAFCHRCDGVEVKTSQRPLAKGEMGADHCHYFLSILRQFIEVNWGSLQPLKQGGPENSSLYAFFPFPLGQPTVLCCITFLWYITQKIS